MFPLNITQPLGIWSIMATIRWCPIFPKWDSYQPLSFRHCSLHTSMLCLTCSSNLMDLREPWCRSSRFCNGKSTRFGAFSRCIPNKDGRVADRKHGTTTSYNIYTILEPLFYPFWGLSQWCLFTMFCCDHPSTNGWNTFASHIHETLNEPYGRND